jgi:glycosyltransferase involved in cell wall biosynthesis
MNVLILHQHFNTPEEGGAIRSYYLARALVDRQVKVTVITAYNGNKLVKKRIEGIDVVYLPVPYENRYGFAARSWAFMKFVWGAIRVSKQFKHYNYCYAISAPLTVGMAAQWIKVKYKIPYIFEVGDLWPEAPIQMEFVTNPIFKRALYFLERSIYKSAHSIVALSPSIKSTIEKVTRGKKVHLIPNMADCDYFAPVAKDSNLEAKYKTEGKFVVSYIGAVGLANGLDYFLECANVSRKADLQIHFFICGDGALLERLKRNAKQLDLKNLTFVDFTNREGVRELLNVTDATFICYKTLPVLETGSPNKFFDGLAAGKLIIINFGGWIKKEVEESGCGIFVKPNHPNDFIKKINPFLSDDKLLEEYQHASRQLAEVKYSREILSREFNQILK